MKRPIDKTKKSNIKCEHCEYFDGDRYDKKKKIFGYCTLKGEGKHYYNRCKQFEWRKDL